MSKLYIRGFSEEIDETQIKRQFGKKRIERVDLIEKKDETGAIITRFCYLFTNTPEQAEAIVTKWNNRRWDGNVLSVKIARESFMERAAKLKQAKVAATNTSEFKPIFEAKRFDESSDSDSGSSEEDEDEKEDKLKRVSTLSNASARLHDKVKSRKDADQRREEAIVQRQELYESRKKATFSGKKTTFSDSDDDDDEEEEEEPTKKGLFDGSDDDDDDDNELTLNLDGKLRDEHEGPEGAKLFQFERANFGGDDRFQMGAEFTADVAQMKTSSDIVAHAKPEKRNQFKAPTRFIPQRESEDAREKRLKEEIAELKREKEKYTNVKAPELEKTTHFGVTGNLAIGEKNQEKTEESGFSLLSMFGRQVEPDDDEGEEEGEKDDEMEVETNEKEPVKQKPTEYKKGITFGGKFRLFPLTFDNTAFYMTPDEIDRQRNELKEEAATEYGILARQGKKRRARDDSLRGQSKVQQVLNWW